MDILERLIQTEGFSEYRHLRNYVLYRKSCINSKGESVEVKLYEDIVRKYVKTYEELCDIFLKVNYKNYDNIIKSNVEEIGFSSKRLDGTRVKLLCGANALELYVIAEPNPYLQRKYNETLKTEILGVVQPTPDDSIFGITTILDEYNAPKTYCSSHVNFTAEGVIVSNASTKIPDMIGEKISGFSQTLGIIPRNLPNK